MRVIAGSAGGLALDTPPTDLRPTMDKVKAAIFSSLGERVPGACVLDLYAGTGALGIEALSRGAASAVFVERDRRATAAIARNLARTRLSGEVRERGVFAYLDSAPRGVFDLIFADPPYAQNPDDEDHAALLLRHPAPPALLRPGGLLVLEKDCARALPPTPLWETLRSRRYGKTEALFLVPARDDAPSC